VRGEAPLSHLMTRHVFAAVRPAVIPPPPAKVPRLKLWGNQVGHHWSTGGYDCSHPSRHQPPPPRGPQNAAHRRLCPRRTIRWKCTEVPLRAAEESSGLALRWPHEDGPGRCDGQGVRFVARVWGAAITPLEDPCKQDPQVLGSEGLMAGGGGANGRPLLCPRHEV